MSEGVQSPQHGTGGGGLDRAGGQSSLFFPSVPRGRSPKPGLGERLWLPAPAQTSLTSSLLSTSNHREMPGKLWVRVSVVRSIHRLCREGTGRYRPLGGSCHTLPAPRMRQGRRPKKVGLALASL